MLEQFACSYSNSCNVRYNDDTFLYSVEIYHYLLIGAENSGKRQAGSCLEVTDCG